MDGLPHIESRHTKYTLPRLPPSLFEWYERALVGYEKALGVDQGPHNVHLQKPDIATHYDITKLLLDQGTDVNTISRKYGTALAAAASKGQQAVATLLLDRGADVNIIGGQYGTALAAAASWGRVDVATLLLDRGADVNIIEGEYGTALGAAAIRGQLEVATLLLDPGADINIIAGQYGTALAVAASKGQQVVATLEEKEEEKWHSVFGIRE